MISNASRRNDIRNLDLIMEYRKRMLDVHKTYDVESDTMAIDLMDFYIGQIGEVHRRLSVRCKQDVSIFQGSKLTDTKNTVWCRDEDVNKHKLWNYAKYIMSDKVGDELDRKMAWLIDVSKGKW